MAGANISVDQDQFTCSVCLDLLKDPVTIPCGHSYCMSCITDCWDQEDQKRIYRCPLCKLTFTPRPVLVDEHKDHDTVSTAAARTEKQSHYEETQRIIQKIIQQREKDLQQLREAVGSHKRSAQTAVEDSERIFTELIRSIERRRSEVIQLIRDQERAAVSQAEERLERLEQEINDLRRRDAEMKQLSHTQDHVHFLQSLSSVSLSGSTDGFTVSSHLSFDEVVKSVSQLRDKLQQFCSEETEKISGRVKTVLVIHTPEYQTREEFLQCFHLFTLDPNTVDSKLYLSEGNTVITHTGANYRYPDHCDRFDFHAQVLCRESISGRCYWEVEYSGSEGVHIAVVYKSIKRKGMRSDSRFGYNNQSWRLYCSNSSCSFRHNNTHTVLPVVSSHRIGVYVDHSAGILSFFSVLDKMSLIHRVQATFTGFGVQNGTTLKLSSNIVNNTAISHKAP